MKVIHYLKENILFMKNLKVNLKNLII